MYVGRLTLSATLTLQSAIVTLSKARTNVAIVIGSTTVTMDTLLTAVTPTFGVVRVFVEVGVASLAVMSGIVSIIEVLLKQ